MEELQQETIDAVVAGTLDGNLSKDVLDKFITTASPYDWPFSGGDGISQHCWLRFEDAPGRLDVMHISPFSSEHDCAVDLGFSEKKAQELMQHGCRSDNDYKKALRHWVSHCYEDGNDRFFLEYLFAVLHELKSIDGRTCIVLEASTQGGQGGWEFKDIFYGCYKSQEDALAFLKSKGLVEPYTDAEVESYISEVIRLTP